MKKLKISLSNFVYKTLNDHECVVYSPEGIRAPFLLSGIAHQIFLQLLSGLDVNQIRNKYQHAVVTDSDFNKTINFFLDNGILGNQTRQLNLSKNMGKSVVNEVANLTFWIHVTDACNLRCDYCYVYKGKAVMNPDVYQAFIDGLEEYCLHHDVRSITLKFAGGEPTLALNQILAFLDTINKRLTQYGVSIRPSIITNGTRINLDTATILKQKGFSVGVSLDGLGDGNNSRRKINGESSVTAVKRGLKNLIDAGITPSILSVISNENMNSIVEMIDFTNEFSGTLFLTLSKQLDENGNPLLDKKKAAQGLVDAIDYLENFSQNAPKINLDYIRLSRKSRKVCGAGISYFALAPDGLLHSCQMTLQTVPDEVDDIKANTVRVLESNLEYDFPSICSKCVWRYACSGGCEQLRANSRLTEISPFCSIYKTVLPRLLEYEGKRMSKAMSEGSRLHQVN